MSIARSTSLIFVSRVLTVVLGLLGLTIFTRILPSDHLGIFFLFQSLLGVLAIPADFGVRTAITKRVSEDTERDMYFTNGLIIKTPLLILISVIIYLNRGWINGYVGADVASLLVVAIWLQEYGLYFMASLKGELQIGETAVWKLLKPVGWTVIGGVLAYFGLVPGAIALILGLVAGMSLMTIVGFWRTSLSVRRPSFTHLKSILKFSSFATLGSVGALAYNWADVIILGFFVTNSEIAAYEVAWKVAMNITFVSIAIRTVMFPQASHWYSNDQVEKIENLLPDLIVISLVAAIPAVVGGALLSEEILKFVFTPEYTIASLAFVVLLFNMLDSSIAQIVGGGILFALDRPDLSLRATVVSMILNIALNVVLIPKYGLLGAAVATTSASFVGTIINIWYVRSFVELRLDWSKVAWIVVSSSIMGAILHVVLSVTDISGLIPLLAIVIFGAAVYSCLILSVSHFRKLTVDAIAQVT